MTSTEIRGMRDGDLDQVLLLETAGQPNPWPRTLFEDEMSRPDRRYLVATEGDRIRGFVGAMVVGDEAHLMNLMVDPGQRRSGIGQRLFQALKERVVEDGASHLTLEVRSRNRNAIAFYSSQGMAPVGVRPGYYGDDDALIMWAHDIDDTREVAS